MRDSPKSHLVTENAGPSKLEGRTAVHFDGPESERQRRDHAQKASSIRYRRLFETAPYGILVLDAETGVIMDVNPAVSSLLEDEQQNIVDRPLWSIPAFRNAAATKSQFRDVVHQPHVRYDDLPLELKNGQIKHIELVSTLFLADNKPLVQCVIHDITDRVKRELADGARNERDALEASQLRQETVTRATHDDTTGLVNRWYLEESLPRELHRAERSREPLTVTVLAPDAGQHSEAILRELGRVIREHLRKSDMAARYAGQEFVLVLPNSSSQAAVDRMEKICAAVRGLELVHGSQRLRGPVVSAGVVKVTDRLTSAHGLINAARAALSQARHSGGNRVVQYQENTEQ